ncbi:hypothetical protein PRUPE_4G245600 [Prunus persica]|uniref:Uncharacterized protein n=1 Tax=Prunus persica TaxID=3760 RepID=A0A251PQE8_PRUPE|nr:hypothetical protein PRUPE_4G245600 [Prunus persica]
MANLWPSLVFALAICFIATNVAASDDKPYAYSSPPPPSRRHHLLHLVNHMITRLLHHPLITKQVEFLFSSCYRLVKQIIAARESFTLVASMHLIKMRALKTA